MRHHELCEWLEVDVPEDPDDCRVCDLVSMARQEERNSWLDAPNGTRSHAYTLGQQEAIDAAADVLDSMMDDEPCDCDRCQTLAMCYALVLAQKEKP